MRLQGDLMLSCVQRPVSPFSLLTPGWTGLSGEEVHFGVDQWREVGSTA